MIGTVASYAQSTSDSQPVMVTLRSKRERGSRQGVLRMSIEAQGRNWWRDLFLPAGPNVIALERYQTLAKLRLLMALPFAVVPTDFFLQEALLSAWDPVAGRYAWMAHCTLMILYFFVNLILLRLSRPGNECSKELLYQLNSLAILCEIGTNQSFMVGFGSFVTYSPIYLIVIVAGYCALFDYRTAMTTCLLASLTYFIFASLELAGITPLAPLLPAPMADGFWHDPDNAVMAIFSVMLVCWITFMLCNFAVNQKIRLHQYVTRSVLQRYLPPSLVDRASTGELKLDAPPERRIVTIMFIDICGFTRLSEKLGPEKVGDVLNEVLGEIADLAHRHGATVDKFIGDCAMVVFGAPDPLPPDQQVTRALALAADLHALIPRLGEAHGLQARTGINTGEVVVGNFGSANRSDYTVIGPPVNVAARLEGKSRPGAILVGQDAVAHLQDRTGLTSAGMLELKGVSAPVEGWFYAP